MKEQKNIFVISSIIVVLSLLIACIIEFIGTIYAIITVHHDFYINLLLGIFSGAMLSVIVSLISYYNNREDALFNYWISLEKHIQEISMFGSKYFKNVTTVQECIEKIQISSEILNDVKRLQFSYTEIVSQKNRIEMFVKKSDLKKNIELAFELVGKINMKITKIMCIHDYIDMPKDRQAEYIIQFNSENSELEKLITITQKLQKDLNISIEKIDLEKEGIICPN